MSELSTLKSVVYDEMRGVITNYVSSPDTHLIREDDDEPDEPPMVALDGRTTERASQNSSTGLHDVRVLTVYENPFDVEYGRERTFSVDVTIADIDGNRADSILEDIQNAFTFSPRTSDSSTLTSAVPIEDVRVRDTSPTDRTHRVGHALSVEIDFLRTYLYSDVDTAPTAVETVVQQYENGRSIEIDSTGVVTYTDS